MKNNNLLIEESDILVELGQYTGKTATLDECHGNGYWHRAVFCLIINSQGDLLKELLKMMILIN